MKTTIFLFISIILFWSNSNAQSGFIFKYSTLFDEIPHAIAETADHGYIIASSFGTYESIRNTLFFRLNKHGDTIKTQKIFSPYNGCWIGQKLFVEHRPPELPTIHAALMIVNQSYKPLKIVDPENT